MHVRSRLAPWLWAAGLLDLQRRARGRPQVADLPSHSSPTVWESRAIPPSWEWTEVEELLFSFFF